MKFLSSYVLTIVSVVLIAIITSVTMKIENKNRNRLLVTKEIHSNISDKTDNSRDRNDNDLRNYVIRSGNDARYPDDYFYKLVTTESLGRLVEVTQKSSELFLEIINRCEEDQIDYLRHFATNKVCITQE